MLPEGRDLDDIVFETLSTVLETSGKIVENPDSIVVDTNLVLEKFVERKDGPIGKRVSSVVETDLVSWCNECFCENCVF